MAGLLLLLAGPGARGLACGPSWSTVPSVQRLWNPQAIAAVSEDDVWVVGGKAGEAGPVTGAEHWDGRSWSLFRTPNVGAEDNMFNGVDAVASKDVWAVGYSGDKRFKTLVEHWDGDRWRVVKSPNVGAAQYNTLTSVDALGTNNAWAVGSYLTAASRKTLIQRWDGTSWRIVSSPNPGTSSNSLLGVAAVTPRDIWAVGWESSGDGLRPLVLHRDDARWTKVAVPLVGTGDNVLTDVSAVSGNDVWATGYYVDGTDHKKLTLHFDGTSWRHVPSTDAGGGVSILKGIGAYSSTNAWAVGFEYRADLQRYVASTQHWDGSAWTAFPSAISESATADSEMSSVAKAPRASRVWAAGRTGNVESICKPGGVAATEPAQKTTATATGSMAQAPEQPRSTEAKSSTSGASVAPSSGRIRVTAVDKAVAAGISQKTRTYGAIISDFNNDQRPEIFLGRHAPGAARLYMNDGDGHFTEIDQGTFARRDRHGCDAADVNGDGLKDIFCSVGAARGTAAKRNELYVQQPDHTFDEQAAQRGVLDPFGRGRLSAFVDANGDALPDLFVANQAKRGDALPSPNRFFINQGSGEYHHAPGYGLEREMGASLYGSSIGVGDLDGDGWEDLVLPTSSGLRVYRNDQGEGFTNVAASLGLGQSPEAVTLADVNGDSSLDVIEVSPNKLRVMLNKGGTFSGVFSTRLRYGTSVAAGDVNGDDRPDIYVLRGNREGVNAQDQLYLNDGTGRNFARMSSIPSTEQGKAESVWPIDHDANGLTDFLVLNGGGQAKGPVQLISFFPDS